MRIINFLKHPKYIITTLAFHFGGIIPISDKKYLELFYERKLGKRLDLKNPKSMNEKIQWLKLYDRKEIYKTLVDKVAVRDYIRDIIGEKYLVPIYGVWNHFDEIDFDILPKSFVLKCNHDSGSIILCKDKNLLDRKAAKKKLEKCLRKNMYYPGREWAYKGIHPQILAEEFLTDEENIVPEDYKIYCFNGEPKLIVVFHNRFNQEKQLSETVYDVNWNVQNFSLSEHFAINTEAQEKPECLDEMLELSRKLCKGFAQIRTDFYIVNGKIYFGELTLYTAAGFTKTIPAEVDDEIGKWIELPR